ncbi:histidine phosphatase family protein [Candidatus Woesearchaeota archaeon]|nr:histidine phosphatase family protein [Candidatus Woesearchaeota archaeon]
MAKKKYCSIYLFRHGQTYFNRDKRFTGWKDSRLTPLGKKQAEKIARMLKGKRIDAAYQTRLSRSKDTLRPVLRLHPECKEVITDDRMIERSYGEFQGKHHSTVEKNLGKEMLNAIRRNYGRRPPRGESVKMVEKRVLPFLKDLLAKIKKEKINVAISAHGNSMRPFRRYFEKLSVAEMMQLENPWDDYFEYKVRV